MKNKKLFSICLLIAFFTVALFVDVKKTLSENASISELDEEEKEETQEKIKELEEKAETYQKIIDIKQKQQVSLNNQIELLEAEVSRVETEIRINEKKIGELNDKINDLQAKIEEREAAMKNQKILLSQLIQKHYEHSKSSLVSTVFGEENYSSFAAGKDQLSQTSQKIKEMLSSIRSIKESMEAEKKFTEESKKEITDLYYELQEKNTELESTKAQKENLVAQTRGEESRYQQLLARVEMQKLELLGDIDQLYSSNPEEINKLLKSLPKPDSGLASTNWYYSQKDSRWGSMRIGQSNSLVKDYGCALTSVAMIFTRHGETTTPGTLAKKKIYEWDLIVWPDGSNVKLIKNTNHRGVSWSEIDRELTSGNPVIVFIKAKPDGAGHYVVIHNKSGSDYVVHDPYFGPNIYLSSSIKLLSALYKTSISKNSVDQMILYRK